MIARTFASALLATAAATLAGCSSGGMFSSGPAMPVGPAAMASTITADGTQQFTVPPEGRAVLRQKLTELIQGHLDDARVSNGWRTAAGASAQPNDYAACVSATAGGQTRYFVIVVAGQTTSGLVSGDPAAQKCQDPARVVQWVPFTEAMTLG